MGRKKIAIKKIEDLTKRYVSFSKRKDGLFKKADTACSMYNGSQIGIIVFSPTLGKLHTFGPVDPLIHQFLHQSSSSSSFPPPHLNSSNADTEGKKRSRSGDDDDRVPMVMEEEETETKKRKLLMSSTTTTTTEAAAAAATTEQEEEEGFLLIKNSESEEGLMMNNEFLMDLEKNVIEQLRTTGELLARLEQGSSYREEEEKEEDQEATLLADPPCSLASELIKDDDDDDDLKEFLNGVADEIITGHHFYEKNWATIDDWDQLLIS